MLNDKDQEEAELFKRHGLFDFKGGCAFVYRDADGVLQNIKIELNTYRRGRENNCPFEKMIGFQIQIGEKQITFT